MLQFTVSSVESDTISKSFPPIADNNIIKVLKVISVISVMAYFLN